MVNGRSNVLLATTTGYTQQVMVSKSDLKNAFLKKSLLSKGVWIPIVLGCSTMAVATGFPFWLGVAAVGVGIGTAIWRFTIGRRKTEEAVIQQLRDEANCQHYAFLRALQRKLRRDRDPTTGKLLRQLRETHKRMVETRVFLGSAEKETWQADVRSHMVKLYESSVGSLERSFDIWSRAQSIRDADLQKELSESRSSLLSEVTTSVERLGKTLDQMQVSSVKTEQPENELSALRNELEQGLAVAKNIEARIDELNKQVRRATRTNREG